MATSASEKVLRGQDHWLFLCNDTSGVVDQHVGARRLSLVDLNVWTTALAGRLAWSRRHGVPYRCLFAPDSHGVYADKLPPSLQARLIAPSRRPVPLVIAQATIAAPEARTTVLYPLQALIEAREVCDTYHRTDTHWNGYGAFIAYDQLMASLARETLEVDRIRDADMQYFLQDREGDLGSKLEPRRHSKCILGSPRGRRFETVYDNRIVNNGWVRVFRRVDSAPASRCLVFGDSFIGSMIPLLGATFGEVVLVHASRGFDFEFAEALLPDVVLSIGVERFAIDPPTDMNGESLRDMVARKRAAGVTSGPELGAFPFDGRAAAAAGIAAEPALRGQPR